jgi:hypothetical protein
LRHDAGFSLRYVTLAIPLIYVTYLVALLYAPPVAGRICQRMLCIVLLLLYWPHYQLAYAWVAPRLLAPRDFEHDLKAGVRTAILAEKHTDPRNSRIGARIYPLTSWVAEQTLQLRKLRIGSFQPTALDGDSRMEPLVLDRLELSDIQWNAAHRMGHVLQKDGRLSIPLPKSEYIQRVYLSIFVDHASAMKCPLSIVCRHHATASTTKWAGELLTGPEPNYIVVAVEEEVSELQLVWGTAPVEFRLPDVKILAGRPGNVDSHP